MRFEGPGAGTPVMVRLARSPRTRVNERRRGATHGLEHIACLLVAASTTCGAAAQPTEPPKPDATLGEIKVRSAAERDGVRAKEATAGVLGELPLIETPFSINVITRKLLDDQQATTYGDYLKNDPSATVGNVGIGFFSLRGFPVGGRGGFLYDGLPGHVALSESYQLEGFDRIEVLKGPSVLLSGLGATSSLGGTVNFVPKRPTEQPLRSFGVNYATRSLLGVDADLGDRFGSERQFGYRLNLGYKDGEQAVERADNTHKAATLALDWRASRELLLSAGLEYADNHVPEIQPFFFVVPGVPVPDAPDASRNISQSWDDVGFVGKSAYLRADWNLAPAWTLTAQALKSSSERPPGKQARFGTIDDAAGNATLFGGEEKYRLEGESGQLLLRGELRTGALAHRLTFGIAGLRDESASSGPEASANLGFFATNIYSPIDYPEPPGIDPPLVLEQKSSARSVLLADIVSLSEEWSVLAGVRRAKLELRNFDPVSGAETSRDSISKTSPTAALMWKPIADALVYLNYAEGLEPGGTAPTGSLNAGDRLPPIVTEQIELGAKLQWRAMLLTAALFDLDRPREFVDATGTFVQNGRQRHRGVEFGASGRIAPRLTVVAGVAWLDPTTKGDAATDGKRPPGVSRVAANVWADYGMAGVPGLFVNAGAYHNGKQFLDAANTQELRGWTRFDIGARVETRIAGQPTVLRLGVENVADRDYWIGQAGILTIAAPRTVKASARFDL